MSWLDEAKKIAEQKQRENGAPPAVAPLRDREALKRRLRLTYGEATEREIDKALDDAQDRFGADVDEKTLKDFFRMRLEE